jgi:LysR family transcriptional regulator, low CO2-responsive transcriptional regulator
MPLRHVSLRQLRVFAAVARHLSFSRAAAELHLTQPAVSMQVKSLEGEAGLPLVEQVGKKIHLTEAGRELQARAHAIDRELRAAEEALGAMRGLTQGRLTIGLVSTAKYFVPELLGRFLKAHPGVTAKLEVDNRETIIGRLAANAIDLAIMGRPPQNMAPPDHPLAGKRRVPLERLAEETFVIREPGSGTRGLLERLFAEHKLTLKVSMEMASNETIKQAVIAGMGVSLLSLHTVGLELATRRLVILDVAGLPIVRKWHVVHLAQKRLSPVAQALKAYLLAEGGRHLAALEAPARRSPRATARRNGAPARSAPR